MPTKRRPWIISQLSSDQNSSTIQRSIKLDWLELISENLVKLRFHKIFLCFCLNVGLNASSVWSTQWKDGRAFNDGFCMKNSKKLQNYIFFFRKFTTCEKVCFAYVKLLIFNISFELFYWLTLISIVQFNKSFELWYVLKHKIEWASFQHVAHLNIYFFMFAYLVLFAEVAWWCILSCLTKSNIFLNREIFLTRFDW